ncbi:mechanosensitive ion channel [Sporichthya brevicatena]|uniref:Mechanosensitive ion channel n=1 Tax=Sporichthya brevicatena TaxID=171442 RepID=A0ABN1GTM4_9ACTN
MSFWSTLPLAPPGVADPGPSPEPSLLVTDGRACFQGVESKGTLCRWVYDNLGKNETLAESSDWLIAKPAKVLLILLAAWLIRKLVHRAIGRMCRRLADGVAQPNFARGWHHLSRNGEEAESEGTLASERRAQRAATVSSVLRSIATGVIYTLAMLMALSEIGLNIGPLIASAGIIGVALGFGAQSVVKDFLSGIFMVIEDQYGVGDVTDLGDASGTVESIGLRVTRLRDVNGTVWYVRNGEILRVGNKSQGWARAVVDVDVAYDEDVSRVRELLLRTANEVFSKPENAAIAMDKPEVWGVEALSADSVVVRLVVKTVPLQQWKAARLLREAIKASFDEAGVEIPFPQRTVWVRSEGDGSETQVEAVQVGVPSSTSSRREGPPAPRSGGTGEN